MVLSILNREVCALIIGTNNAINSGDMAEVLTFLTAGNFRSYNANLLQKKILNCGISQRKKDQN